MALDVTLIGIFNNYRKLYTDLPSAMKGSFSQTFHRLQEHPLSLETSCRKLGMEVNLDKSNVVILFIKKKTNQAQIRLKMILWR